MENHTAKPSRYVITADRTIPKRYSDPQYQREGFLDLRLPGIHEGEDCGFFIPPTKHEKENTDSICSPKQIS